MRFCPKCGMPIPEDEEARFCPHCGAALTPPTAHKERGEAVPRRFAAVLIVALLITGSAAIVGYISISQQLNTLQKRISNLENQQSQIITGNQQYQVTPENISLTQFYMNFRDSVVMIDGFVVQQSFFRQQIVEVQGSGFVYNLTGRMVVVTNFHVIDGASDITVAFRNGDAYPTTVLGSDPYSDLAILSASAPTSEFKPLQIVSSSTLNVGDLVIAIGNPFGLTGSMTTGIVSQLGRTITESTTGGFSIADIIQISAPINPGNSGGPLLNDKGQVVGVTTAVVSGSQGVGFAIPSNAILREIRPLVNTGTYTQHPWLGIGLRDMTYQIAKKMNLNVTYGALVTQTTSGGPAAKAGIKPGTQQVSIEGSTVTIGGDVIIALNGAPIVNTDGLSTYLEENTLPNQTINVTIVRNSATMTVPVVLGTRPST